MQNSDDRYRRATLALAEELAGCVRQRDEARQVVDELHNQVGALTRACVELARQRDDARDTLATIWLYVSWPYVTRKLTTEQKELWADAVDAFGEPGPKAVRWWRDGALDDGRRLVRIDDGDREAMAEVLVEAFVDGDPETCQTIVDKLGEQSEH